MTEPVLAGDVGVPAEALRGLSKQGLPAAQDPRGAPEDDGALGLARHHHLRFHQLGRLRARHAARHANHARRGTAAQGGQAVGRGKRGRLRPGLKYNYRVTPQEGKNLPLADFGRFCQLVDRL